MATAKKTATKKSSSKNSTNIVLEFEFERDTKNTRRFLEVEGDEGIVIGPLYVQKSAFKGSLPETLTVTIES